MTNVTSPLERLAGPKGPLVAEPPDAREFAALCHSAEDNLSEARRPDIKLGARFLLAYAAAHGYCLAALRHKGFRAHHRYIVFQALPHTLGVGPEIWNVLSKAHDRRNLAEYEGHIEASEALVQGILKACENVAALVKALPPIVRAGQ